MQLLLHLQCGFGEAVMISSHHSDLFLKKIRLKKSKTELPKYKLDNLETLLLVCKTFSKNQIPPCDAAARRRAFREAQSSVLGAQHCSASSWDIAELFTWYQHNRLVHCYSPLILMLLTWVACWKKHSHLYFLHCYVPIVS